MTQQLANRLIQMKTEIEEAKEKRSRLEGKQESLMAKLKEDFNCDSLEKAKRKENQLQKQYEKLETQLEKELDKIESILEEGEKQ